MEKELLEQGSKDRPEKEYDTQLAIHSVQNILGNKQQLSLFEEKNDAIQKEFGLKLEGSIDRFGVNLSDIEFRVMESIIKGFTKTNYKGNMAPKEVAEVANEKYDGVVPKSYQFLKELPRLRVTQKDIMGWCHLKDGIGRKERVIAALKTLGTTQFCFYYDRLAFDDENKPLKDSNGKWKKESVVVVDTLFTIKQVKNPSSDKHSYYEITPSSIFLDQRENYFIMMRNNWREEVIKLVGNKKASSYTFRLLMFLCYQYELKRRNPSAQKPYQIRWSPEDIATAIKMPTSVILKNKKRMNSILDDAYSVAKSVGYLESYERLGYVDCLLFDEKKYYDPAGAIFTEAAKSIAQSKTGTSKIEKYLFDVYHIARQEIDRGYKIPTGESEKKDLMIIKSILKNRSAQDVEDLIKWGMKKSFWCTRISSLSKLKNNFEDAWLEMKAQSSGGTSNESNKDWVQGVFKKLKDNIESKKLTFDIANQYVQIGETCFGYTDKKFKELVQHQLTKFGIQ